MLKEVAYLSVFFYGVVLVYCLIVTMKLHDKYRTLEYKYEELKKQIEDKSNKKKPKHMKLYEGDN